jgi:hypothetical protein
VSALLSLALTIRRLLLRLRLSLSSRPHGRGIHLLHRLFFLRIDARKQRLQSLTQILQPLWLIYIIQLPNT